jgi:hypothetical protein
MIILLRIAQSAERRALEVTAKVMGYLYVGILGFDYISCSYPKSAFIHLML